MSYKLWKDQRDTFELLDLRGRIDNVLTELTEMAAETRKGQGIHVIQSFRPIMYYGPMSKLGFEYHTEQKGSTFTSAGLEKASDNVPRPLSKCWRCIRGVVTLTY